MKKSYWITALVIVGFALITWLGIKLYSNLKRPVATFEQALEPSTTFFLKFRPDRLGTGEDLLNSDVYKVLSNIDGMSNEMKIVGEVFEISKSHEEFSELINNEQAVFSVGLNKRNEAYGLFIFQLQHPSKKNKTRKLLYKLGNARPDTYRGHDILKIESEKMPLPYYTTVIRGLILAATSQPTIEQTIDQLLSTDRLENYNAYEAALQTAGKKVVSNLFVNIERLPEFFNKVFHPIDSAVINNLQKFGSWMAADINFDESKVQWSGFVTANQELLPYFSVFNKEKVSENKIGSILPGKTSLLLQWRFNNSLEFFGANKKWLIDNQLNYAREQIMQINISKGVDVEASMTQWIDQSLALVYVKGIANPFVVAQAIENEIALQSLDKLAGAFETLNGPPDQYDQWIIRSIQLKGLLSFAYGKLFPEWESTYYTMIKNNIVFASSRQDLINFIKQSQSGLHLDQRLEYMNYMNYVDQQAKMILYADMSFIPDFLNSELKQNEEMNYEGLGNFKTFGIYFKPNSKELTYSGMYLSASEDIKPIPQQQETITSEPKEVVLNSAEVWSVQLDAAIHSGPYRVISHRDQKERFIVFDKKSQIYFIDSNGKIEWKRSLNGLVQSPVYTVDLLKNNKNQYLFNTNKSVYLFDVLGNQAGVFPLKINAGIKGGLGCFDYQNNKEYRMVLSDGDNYLMNYQLNGKRTEGWNNHQIQNGIIGVPKHLVVNSKDYLVVKDKNATLHFLNRRGNIRMSIKDALTLSKNSSCYVKEGKDEFFLTTDAAGKLVFIDNLGGARREFLATFSLDHQFDYSDFDGDGAKDYIYADKSGLRVYNSLKQELFKWEKSFVETPEMKVYSRLSANGATVVLREKSGQIIMIDRTGRLSGNSNINGDHFPVITKNESGLDVIYGKAQNLKKVKMAF